MKTLDIIIVSYNTAEYTARAIQSVIEQTKEVDYSITVVDNDSQDNSVTLIKKRFPEVNVIESGANLGFAAGVNIGTQSTQAKHILLLNPDTLILDGAIDKLYQFALAHPDNGIWGGTTLNDDHSINTHNAWARIDTKTLLFSALGLSKLFSSSCFFNAANYGCWDRKSIRTVDIIQGSFLMTSRTAWNQLEGLDDTFFMYGEESDYCIKAIHAGYQPIITPDAHIVHHGGVSEKNFSGKMIKLLKGKIELVNRYSHLKILHKALLFLYVSNKTLTSQLISLLKKNKKPMAKEWQKIFNHRAEWLKGYQR